MGQEDLATRLMRLFLGELEDHERTLEQDMLALERTEDEAARLSLIENLFRAAHSLKGAARAVNATSIEGICHRLEQTLTELRAPGSTLDKAMVARLFADVDAVKAAAGRLRGSALPERAMPATPPPREPAMPALAQTPPTIANASPANSLHEVPQVSAGALSGAQMIASSALATVPTPDGRNTRVATQKLDELLAQSSELVVSSARLEIRLAQLVRLRDAAQRIGKRARILHRQGESNGRGFATAMTQLERDLEHLETGLRLDVGTFNGSLRQVDDEVRRLRMVPVREAYDGLERSVRDLARSLDKEAHLIVGGEPVEVDREVVLKLRDPLLHLVRNAVSHGIEPTKDRVRAGKPARGTISISATMRGGVVELVVDDDGQGLDFAAIRARARAMGLPEVSDDEELAAYIFAPGFSTAKQLSEIAGRGVGLDAVKRSVEALHGTASVMRNAVGARFVLRVPLTLSKLRCLFVRVAGHGYAVPTTHCVRVLRFRLDELLHMGGNELVRANDELVPVVPLAKLLGFPGSDAKPRERAEALVVSSINRSVALIVDALVDERESILSALPERLVGARYVSGATMRARGQIALVLNGSELGHAALASLTRASEPLFQKENVARRKVLVADDSITTRALMKSIIEEGGYDVVAARDGKEAFRLLSEQPFDLLVSDVQMPNMDGYALTEQVRATPKFARLPIVLVTSLESERDRLRGLQAGANAYLGKSAFDHRVLLEVIGGLL